MENSTLLSGAAGTGKTVILMNVLNLAKKDNKKALYVSYNQLLVDKVKNIYDTFIKDEDSECKFYSLIELEANLSNIEKNVILDSAKITKWVQGNVRKYKNLKCKDVYQIVSEIRGIIKGYLGLEYSEVTNMDAYISNKLTFDKYLNIPKQYSYFDY